MSDPMTLNRSSVAGAEGLAGTRFGVYTHTPPAHALLQMPGNPINKHIKKDIGFLIFFRIKMAVHVALYAKTDVHMFSCIGLFVHSHCMFC